jgi:hypothetical protein
MPLFLRLRSGSLNSSLNGLLPHRPAGLRHPPDQYARLAQALAVFGKRLKPICDGLVSHISGNAKQGPRHLQTSFINMVGHNFLQAHLALLRTAINVTGIVTALCLRAAIHGRNAAS